MSEGMSNDELMAMKLARIRELQSRRLGGERLSDEELKEGLSLIYEVRSLRAGKVSKEKGKKVAEEAQKDLADLF